MPLPFSVAAARAAADRFLGGRTRGPGTSIPIGTESREAPARLVDLGASRLFRADGRAGDAQVVLVDDEGDMDVGVGVVACRRVCGTEAHELPPDPGADRALRPIAELAMRHGHALRVIA